MRRLITAVVLAAVSAAAAQAHNPWIKPSAASVAGQDNWITFDAAASTDPFVADHQPMRLPTIHAFAPDGTETPIENGTTGRYRSTFDLHLTQQGTYRVAIVNGGIVGSYMLNGELHRVGGRGGPGGPGGPGGMPRGAGEPGGTDQTKPGGAGIGGGGARAPAAAAADDRGVPPRVESGGADFVLPAGATDVKLGEMASRVETFVTLGKPSAIAMTGKGLELQPVSHPDDLVTDEAGRFRFLIDGKPAAGLAVRLIADGRRYRDAVDEIALTSDANGEVTVKWPAPGLYWLSAAAIDGRATNAIVKERRLSYVTTLEVMAP